MRAVESRTTSAHCLRGGGEKGSFDGRSGGTNQPMTLRGGGRDRGLGDFGSASIDERSMRAENAKRQTFDAELNFEAK